MIISAKLIKNPRKIRFCDECEQPIIGPVLRLYGSAFDGDPPHVLYVHPHQCIYCERKDPKIQKALNPERRGSDESYRLRKNNSLWATEIPLLRKRTVARSYVWLPWP